MLYVYKCIKGPDFAPHLILQSSGFHAPEKKAGDHSFVVSAPRLWNELPIQLREAVSVPVFKRLVKAHLYQC